MPAEAARPVFRLFASVEAALPPDAECEDIPNDVATGMFSAYELLARACLTAGDWAAAAAAGGEMLKFWRQFQACCSPDTWPRQCLDLVTVAEYLTLGPKQECFDTCSRMMRFAIEQV
jgi:hypothetical protein